MAADPSKQPQNPAPAPTVSTTTQNPAPAVSSTPQVTNPFKEGTKKFLVAKALLSGELDRGKMVRETGVSLNTVYNVTGELAKLGYTLAIHQIQPPTITLPPTPTPTSTHQATHPATPVGSQSDTLGGTTHQVTQPNQSQVTPQQPPSVPLSTPMSGNSQLGGGSGGGNNSSVSSLGGSPGTLSQDMVNQVANRIVEIMQGKTPQGPQLPGKELPLEDVELIGEKVNYKIALNPEIFYRYSIFKAKAAMTGKKWDGSLSDFIDMATKDILAVYGMYPTVMTTKGKSVMVEIPGFMQEAQQG